MAVAMCLWLLLNTIGSKNDCGTMNIISTIFQKHCIKEVISAVFGVIIVAGIYCITS